jgi:hypothetical protein
MSDSARTTALIHMIGRTGDADWADVRSWYGGGPQMGPATGWPKGADGRPLPFLAQIDLGQIALTPRPAGLPAQGTLLFFADTEFSMPDKTVRHPAYGQHQWPCAVICQPPGALLEDRAVPGGTPPVFGRDWNSYVNGIPEEEAPRSFGRMAIRFESFRSTPASFADDLTRQVLSQRTFWPYLLPAIAPPAPAAILWRVVAMLVAQCRIDMATGERMLTTFMPEDPKRMATLERLRTASPRVEALLSTWAGKAASQDPNAEIGAANGAALMDDLDMVRAVFADCGVYSPYVSEYSTRPGVGGHMDVPDYWYHGRASADACIRMVTGCDADFAALPAAARRELDRVRGEARYVQKSHDMFCGIDRDDQMNPVDDALRRDGVLLLEITSSFLWTWGDMGKLQFWIEAADLAAQAWDRSFLLLNSG